MPLTQLLSPSDSNNELGYCVASFRLCLEGLVHAYNNIHDDIITETKDNTIITEKENEKEKKIHKHKHKHKHHHGHHHHAPKEKKHENTSKEDEESTIDSTLDSTKDPEIQQDEEEKHVNDEPKENHESQTTELIQKPETEEQLALPQQSTPIPTISSMQ